MEETTESALESEGTERQESSHSSAGTDGDGNRTAHARRKPSKAMIASGVVVVVVIIAGLGFWSWHETPGFCSAICHTPMGGYQETLEATLGEPAVDKYGNDVSDSSAMLAASHATDEIGADCLACHVPTLGEQISEGQHWLTGDYAMVGSDSRETGGALVERDIFDLTEARGLDGDEFCLNESCHDITREELTELTQKESDDSTVSIKNPHSWRHGEVACSDCHKAHRASVLTCTECHVDMELPSGWISMQEAKRLGYTN